MTPGAERMTDIYENFCQGTVTDPIDRPKPAMFLLAAFGIGFSRANIPQWWHRLLPPDCRCILGQDDEEDTVVATQPRSNITNAARARSRADVQNASFWESSAPIFERYFGEPPAAAPSQHHSEPSVSAETCVQVMQVLNSAQLADDEVRLRRAAVSRLTAMLERPSVEMPPSQRQRVSLRPVRRSQSPPLNDSNPLNFLDE